MLNTQENNDVTVDMEIPEVSAGRLHVPSWKPDLVYGLMLAFVDCLAIFLAFQAAFFLRLLALPAVGYGVGQTVPLEPYIATPWLILFWPAVFYYEGLYERGLGNWDELIRTLKGSLFATLLVMGITFVTHSALEYSRAIILGTGLVTLLVVPTLRMYFRTRFLTPFFPIRVLLFARPPAYPGRNRQNLLLAKCGYKVLQVIALESNQEETEMKPYVCQVAAEVNPDAIFLDPEGINEEAFGKILRCVESTGCPVKVFSSFSIFQLRASVRNLDGLILFDLNGGLARPWSCFIKRTLDVIITTILLIFCAPLFAVVGLLIRLDSPGPVFYSHRRLGPQGRLFRCWKFRTMYCNADERLREWKQKGDPRAREFQDGFKLKKDPRITRVGRFLRKWSVDELPQLFNVLQGEMSLVGPRPIVPEEVTKYGKDFQYLLMLRGGMTGLWQVSGRNDTDYSQRVALDTYYVRNWSVWLDIVTLVKTIEVVLRRSGAY